MTHTQVTTPFGYSCGSKLNLAITSLALRATRMQRRFSSSTWQSNSAWLGGSEGRNGCDWCQLRWRFSISMMQESKLGDLEHCTLPASSLGVPSTLDRTVCRSQSAHASVEFGEFCSVETYAGGAACFPSSTASAFDTRSQASAMTLSKVPVNMTFCMPVANRVGQTRQRMTACAVRDAMNSEQRVCWEIGNEAREDRWLRQR